MGIPLPNGKLAMWLFLVTEIMFFTALIGVYLINRGGQPTASNPWPTPHDVHLVELIGAINTIVLIVSSFTVVLAHYYLHHHNVKKAVQMIGITLALGTTFLVIKAFEYQSKFSHQILPGRVFEKLGGPPDTDTTSAYGYKFVRTVEKQLDDILISHGKDSILLARELEKLPPTLAVATPKELQDEKLEQQLNSLLANFKNASGELLKAVETIAHGVKTSSGKVLANQAEQAAKAYFSSLPAALQDCNALLRELPNLSPKTVNERILGTKRMLNKHPNYVDLPEGANNRDPVVGILEKDSHLHLSYSIPWGNMWASCYFAMTGFHALHVLGGLVVFSIMLIMAWKGQFGVQQTLFVELTGLYWHFVDIVWIFLFPLLYLV